jgi:ADP-ribose pyrophosphatase YjhB (NUDIX family)
LNAILNDYDKVSIAMNAQRNAINYCNQCGAPVQLLIPPGDTHLRHVCPSCGNVHYRNPKVVVGCIPSWEDQVLLCRRAIEPRYGLWTLPAGFMELGETVQAGAVRETLEEAGARVAVDPLYTLFNIPHVSQVYLLFRSRLLDLDFAPGVESLEVALFREGEIPWLNIAFPAVRETLRLYFRDRAQGCFGLYSGDIVRTPTELPRYRLVEHHAKTPARSSSRHFAE